MRLSCVILSSWMLFVCVVCQNTNVMLDQAAAKQGESSAEMRANSSAGLDGAASGGGYDKYYYDKLRYKSDKPYSYNSPGYVSPNSYPSPVAYPSYGPSDYANAYVTQSCYGQTPGVFGNAAYECKSFSICQADGRLDIMDCPAYLKFNNYLGVCDWPYKVDAYCNPIYKEEDYSSNYGKSSYVEGKAYDKPAYAKPVYEKPSYVAPVYNSYSALKNYGYPVNQYAYPSSNGYGTSNYYPSSYSSPGYQNYYKKY